MNKSNKKSNFYVNRAKQIVNAGKIIGSFLPSSKKVYNQSKKEFNTWLKEARVKIKNPAKSNGELGDAFFEEGNIKDALFRYKMAFFMNKDELYDYKIGKCQISLLKKHKAEERIKNYLKKESKSEEAKYFLSLVANNAKNVSPTIGIIKENFNIFAPYFNEHFVHNINYNGHTEIFEAFRKNLKDKSKFINLLDLGCSNGILAELIKENMQDVSITGLDISKPMIKNCQELEYETKNKQDDDSNEIIQNKEIEPKSKKTYDILINEEYSKYFAKKTQKYQYILARGIINYESSLDQFFKTSHKILDKKGKLFFYITDKYTKAIEEEIEKERYFPYYLRPEFHTKKSVEAAIKKAKMKLIKTTKFDLERNVKATLYEVEN